MNPNKLLEIEDQSGFFIIDPGKISLVVEHPPYQTKIRVDGIDIFVDLDYEEVRRQVSHGRIIDLVGRKKEAPDSTNEV